MTMKKARALLEQQLKLPPGALKPAKQMCSEIVDQVCPALFLWSGHAPSGVHRPLLHCRRQMHAPPSPPVAPVQWTAKPLSLAHCNPARLAARRAAVNNISAFRPTHKDLAGPAVHNGGCMQAVLHRQATRRQVKPVRFSVCSA